MRHRGRTVSRWEDRGLARTRAMFALVRGADAVPARAAAIAALDSKDWRGVTVYRVRCDGDFGRGPHDVYLPERVLWALIDLSHHLCPFHQ